MRLTIPQKRFAVVSIMAFGLTLVGCTNDDYDFNEIDSTVGIGGGELVLPVSTTDKILLDDVLDIDGTECVKIDEVTKDYIFSQDGGDVEPARPNIDRITISQDGAHDNRTVPFVITSAAKGHGVKRAAGAETAVAEGTLNLFTYTGDKPEEVVALYEATSESGFSLRVMFSDALKNHVSKLNTLTLSFSRYMVLSNLTVSQNYQLVNGSEIRLTDVSTANSITISGHVNTLDFRKGEADPSLGKLVIDDVTGEIRLNGQVNVRAEFDMTALQTPSALADVANMSVSSVLDLDNFVVTGAKGLFNPHIDLDNLGDTEVGDVPSFLTDGNVVIDLYNPQIILELSNDMDVEGIISGTITAYKDGQVIKNEGRDAIISVSGIHVDRYSGADGGSKVTKICICRNAQALANKADYTYVKEVANLSDLIRTIPDKVTFTAMVEADATKEGSFKLGHEYNVVPKYSINAPLAFGEDARIVYTDSIDDWNGDLQDFDLADGAYVELTANIGNREPLYLTIRAEALAVGGKALGSDKVSVTVDRTIVASANGADSGTTPVVIKVKPNKKGALKELDGLAVTFEGDATDPANAGNSVTGVTLNSEKHYIKATDIRVKVVGQVIAEL